MMLDPKGLEAAYDAGRDYVMEMDDRTKQMLRVSISAYLSTVTPAEVGGLVERLNIKAGVMEMGERIAWGSDTAIMREAATALAAKGAELAREKLEHDVTFQKAVNYSARLKESEAQLAEANKALDRIAKILPGNVNSDTLITATNRLTAAVKAARRAREQGGENG